MNLRTQMRRACFVSLLSVTVFLSACSSREDKAQAAFNNYQAALATGSLPYIRTTLLQLVAVDDDNPQYWAELGRVQLQLGALPDAYYAFTRAYELERSNADVLRVLTQLALRGGDLAMADQHAEQLSLLAPDDPAVKVTKAYVALRRSNFDEAERIADELVAASPFEAGPIILKARVLLRTGQGDAAVNTLEEQVRRQPADLDSLRALIGILDRRDAWLKVAGYGDRFTQEQPGDTAIALVTLAAALRSGQLDTARRVSLQVLKPEASPALVRQVLDLWIGYGPPGAFVGNAVELGKAAPGPLKSVYGTYLNDAGAPDLAARMVQSDATLPVNADNANANAVFASSLALRNRMAEALQRYGEVLSHDPNHAEALEGRARLLLRLNQLRRARLDAQRLVTVSPGDSGGYILLSDVYAALGDRQQAGRVLWNGFHQISADRNIYEALRVFVSRSDGADAARRIDEEFSDQRDAELTREFI